MQNSTPLVRLRIGFYALAAAVMMTGCGDDPDNAAPLPVVVIDEDTYSGEFCFDAINSSDSDGDIVAWQWSRLADSSEPSAEVLKNDGAILCLDVARMVPNDPDDHIYQYQLTVTDDRGTSANTAVEAWVPQTEGGLRTGLSASAGPDQVVDAGQTVILSGQIYAGEYPCEVSSCTWEQVAGPPVALSPSPNRCQTGQAFDTGFTAPSPIEGSTFVKFRLRLDGTGRDGTSGQTVMCSGYDYIAVEVRPAR